MENVSQASVFSIDGRGQNSVYAEVAYTTKALPLFVVASGSPTASVASMSVSNKGDVCS